MQLAVRTLGVAFWVSLVALVGWIFVSALDADLVAGRLGQKTTRAVDTVLYGLLALTSGLEVLYHRITTAFVDPDRYSSPMELFYVFVLFFALFFGTYSFFGWYYY